MLRILQILSASLVVLNLTGCGTTRCIVQRLDNLGKRCFCLQDSLCCDSGCQPGCPHSSGQAVVQPMAMQPTFAQPMMQQPMVQQPMMQQQPPAFQQPMAQENPPPQPPQPTQPEQAPSFLPPIHGSQPVTFQED